MSGGVLCRYSAFSPYLALSHSISAHQSKTLLYICNIGSCDYQCLAEVDMFQHMKVEHSDHGNSPLVCSVTLVIKKSSGDGFVECPVLVKRTGAVEYVTSIRVKSTSPTRAATTAKRSIRDMSVSSSEDDDESVEEEVHVSPKRQLRQNVNTKGKKIPKVGLKVAGRRKTRQASKAKAAKKIRVDVESDSEDELQNTTVTSTNDRSNVKGTATTMAIAEEDEDNTENNSCSKRITAAEQGDETNVIATAEQTAEDTEDESHNVAAAVESEITEQVEATDTDGVNDGTSDVIAAVIAADNGNTYSDVTQLADEGISGKCISQVSAAAAADSPFSSAMTTLKQ